MTEAVYPIAALLGCVGDDLAPLCHAVADLSGNMQMQARAVRRYVAETPFPPAQAEDGANWVDRLEEFAQRAVEVEPPDPADAESKAIADDRLYLWAETLVACAAADEALRRVGGDPSALIRLALEKADA